MRNSGEKREKICYVATKASTIKVFFKDQLQYLANNGYDVTVVCSPDDELADDLGAAITYVPIKISRGISVFTSITAIFKLTGLFKAEKYSLVQYSTPNAAFCASIAATFGKIRVKNYHLMGFRYLGSTGIARIILKAVEKFICWISTSIECVSMSNLRLGVEDRIFPESKAVVVGNGSSGGVLLSKFSGQRRECWRFEVRQELGYSSDDFVYGFVGRITRDKGVNEIIEGFLALNDNSKLLFVGRIDGLNTLDKKLLDKARNNGNILFHSRVDDIERYYAAMDVLLLPSYREGFGNVVIEAAAVGTPAIVSAIPGPIDAIELGKTALVVPPKDSAALAQAMKKIRGMDYNLMGVNARDFAIERFDSVGLCEKVLERKQELLNT